jgi:hypothetical protein
VRHELVLATDGIREDLRKTKTAMLSLGIRMGVAALSGLLLILMLPHMLNALAGLPLWACYGIVGGLLTISGGMPLLIGTNTIARIDGVLPHTVETLKENVQWITERATSEGTSKAHAPR